MSRKEGIRAAVAGFGLLAAALLFASSSPMAAPQSARTPAQAPVSIKGFVDTYCVSCHSTRLKTADLVLENRDINAMGTDAAIWEKVVTKLHAGAMPPPTSRRPDPAAHRAFIAAVENALDQSAARAPNPGRPPIHRLNRLEYTNAIRDLFDLEIDGKTMLPADDSGFGFDNIADVLSVSPGLLERYLLAANKISRLVVGDPALVPGVTVYEVSDRTMGQDDRMGEELPFGSRGGAAIKHYFPLDGE
jgi:mono/diheme cytochrome c family protein